MLHKQRQKTQRHLYSTDWRWGLASGVTEILGLASGVTQILALGNAKIYQHVGIFWRYLMPSPDASSFASQWNIGFTIHFQIDHQDGRRITFREFVQLVCRASNGLIRAGMVKKDVLSIVASNNIYFPIMVHAALLAGGTVTSCSPLCKQGEICVE